jgi:hypothetical protein
MSLADDWRRLFPYEETGKVVDLVQQTWDWLVSSNIPKFNPQSSEPHLTMFLRSVLKTKQSEIGLTGHFSAEEFDADADLQTGLLKNRGRTDIRYFSDRINIDLTFEFKKLKANSSSRLSYYGREGMLRFVDGKYSRDRHLGFMVGIIAAEPGKCISALRNAIAVPDVAAQLHLVRSPDGVHIQEPSRELPDKVQFDTEHSRTTIGNQPDIVLCHLFLLYGDAADLIDSPPQA